MRQSNICVRQKSGTSVFFMHLSTCQCKIAQHTVPTMLQAFLIIPCTCLEKYFDFKKETFQELLNKQFRFKFDTEKKSAFYKTNN